MAEGYNRVQLMGSLGAEPELRFGQSGTAVLHMRLATNESYLDKDKVRRERTDWHNITVFGKRGESLAKILIKGSSIFVEGSLRTSSYDNREGQKVWKTEVIASNVLLTGSKPGGRGAPREEQPAPEPAADDGGGYGDDDSPF